MPLDRRSFITVAALSASATASEAARGPALPPGRSSLGIDAIELGIRPGSPDDQSQALQRALDLAAGARVPLVLGAGKYRAANLKLMTGAQLVGVRGATHLVLAGGSSLVTANRADDITLSGLLLDGVNQALPSGHGLVHLTESAGVRIIDCDIRAVGGTGLVLEAIAGEVTGSTVVQAMEAGIIARDSRGLLIARNVVRDIGNNGIQVWRSQAGDDGTFVYDNRIEGVRAVSGGSGQYGNGINVFRAGNVVVKGNRIRDCAFSAVRGNAASNLQVIGNNCTRLGEVALYAEFGFEGAVIANNVVDGAAIGVSITNFNEGGRLAVVQGNVIRNLLPQRPAGTDPNDSAGIGISIEADTAVTGNVVENAPSAGIAVGHGPYLRDVTITGNVVRRAGAGIIVSVAPGAGAAVIADNLIAETRQGAIIGVEWRRAVTGDLAVSGAARHAHLTISGNRVR
jgi:uncharacterized secreted repeat protein (TIGR03808 family)